VEHSIARPFAVTVTVTVRSATSTGCSSWREALGDGSFGGLYQRSRQDESRVWEAAVEGSRKRLADWE